MKASHPSVPAARRVVILGATGSIGRQAIEVAAALPGLAVAALVAGRNVTALLDAAAATGAALLGLHDPEAAAAAAARSDRHVYSGDDGIAALIATAAHEAAQAGAELIVLNGIVGAAGLRASLATLAATSCS